MKQPVRLDCRRLLGFRLQAEHVNTEAGTVTPCWKVGTKVGGKLPPSAAVGAKVGGKPPPVDS
jgi:hypothetical protein